MIDSATMRSALAQARETRYGAAPKLKIREADDTILATLTLPNDPFTEANGVLTKSGTWSGTASAAGTAAKATLHQSDDTLETTFTLSASGGAGEIQMSVNGSGSTTVTDGATIEITAATITQPAS